MSILFERVCVDLYCVEWRQTERPIRNYTCRRVMVCSCRLWATDYITWPSVIGYTPQSDINFIVLNSDIYEKTKVLLAGGAEGQFCLGSPSSWISVSRVWAVGSMSGMRGRTVARSLLCTS